MSKLSEEFFRNRADGRLAYVSLVLRVLGGLVFVASGYMKLIDLEFTASGLAAVGFPDTVVIAFLLGLLEFVGGLMLIIGLGTRLAALGLFIVMIGANIVNALTYPSGLPVTIVLLIVMGYLLWAGPGAYAVDNRLAAKISSPG